MNQKFKDIAEFYLLANKLKTLIRAGWQQWDVSAPRLESVAEHIYGTQMLAIAVWSELDYDIDIQKVIMLLATHELGEILVGDITPLDQIEDSDKHAREIAAVEKVLGDMVRAGDIQKYYDEYETRNTKEAKFAKQIDKLEAELQVKLYDQAGYCDVAKKRIGFDEEVRQKYIVEGNASSLSEAWIDYDIEHQSYDEKILDFVKWLRENKLNESEGWVK